MLILLTALAAGCAREGGPVVVALAGPFSQPRGESMRLAAELARDELNRAGGIGGRPLELLFADDSADADAAVRVAQRLYDDDRVVAVIGHLTSATTLAAAPIYNGGARPVVQVTPSASAPAVTAAGAWTFAICPTDLAHGTRLAEWARERMGARRVAVLYQNDEYGRGVRAAFTRHFTWLGGTVVSQDPYSTSMATFEPYLQRLRRGGAPDAIMIAGARREAEQILAGMRGLGLDLPVLGGDGLSGIEAAAGLPGSVFVSRAYFADQPGARNEGFVRAYREAFEGRLPDHRGAGTYDILHLLVRAMREAGPGRPGIRDYLEEVGRAMPAFEGVTGRIAFGVHGDVPEKDVQVGQAVDGQLVSASVSGRAAPAAGP